MRWIDQALATLTPADVADRLDRSVRSAAPEANYAALRRAITNMTPLELDQLAMAFDIPLLQSSGGPTPEMLFDPQEPQKAVLAHFLTMPPDFNQRLAAFLVSHPRALAYFDDSDAATMLLLESKPARMPYAALAAAGALAAAVGFGVVRSLHF